MELATFGYADGAWSEPFPALDSSQTLVLAFAAPAYGERPEILAELAAAFPTSVVIGCSTSGEIDQTRDRRRLDHRRGRAVRDTRACATRSRRLASAADSFAAGVAIADASRADDLRAVIVLSEGVARQRKRARARAQRRLTRQRRRHRRARRRRRSRFAQTWVLADGEPQTNAVVAVGLYGDAVRVTHGSQGGWDAFGPERVVTASTRQRAARARRQARRSTLYKEYLGDRAAGLPSSALLFPLALRASNDDQPTASCAPCSRSTKRRSR